METEQQKKFLLAGIMVAVMLHLMVFYFIGWANLFKGQQPGKVFMPVTMLLKPVKEINKPETHVPVKRIVHMPSHVVKQNHKSINTGHNKLLSSVAKTSTSTGFSVPQEGNVTPGTVLSGQSNSSIPPLPVFNPMPVIPPNLRAQRYNTSVRVEFFVNKDATFTIKLLSSTGYDELDREVMDTLKRWKFSPATMNGESVKGTLKLRIQFSVN
jgi:TonB family protein